MKTILTALLTLVLAAAAGAQNLSDTTPAAPAGNTNIHWQKDNGHPANISGYIPTPVSVSTANTFTAQQTFSNGVTLNGFNISAPPQSYCVFDGDSITTNGIVSPSSGSWPNQFILMQWGKSCATVQNVAVSGNKISDRITAYPTGAHNYSPAVTGKPGYYFILIGANDIDNSETAATMFTSIQSLWSLAKTDGYTIIAFTVFPRGDAATWSAFSEQARQGLNSSIKSVNNTGKYDYLVDAAILLPDPYDTNFFQSDHIHPTIAGMTVLANAVTQALMTGSQHTPGSTLDAYPLLAGSGNTRTSFTALQALTTGTNNSAGGFNAGIAISTGTDNTTYGFNAMKAGNPSKTVCIGSQACVAGAGSDSTFVGYAAAFTGATGANNSGFGEQTFNKLTSGSSNTAVGYLAGSQVTTTSNATFIGANAGQNAVNADTTALGFNACSSASTGVGAVCVGKSAVGTATSATAVGANAQATALNAIAFGGQDGGTAAVAGGNTAVQIAAGTNNTANTVQYQSTNFLDSNGNATFKTLGTTVGTAIASAATIAPVNGITHITGTAAISTITVPTVAQGGAAFKGCLKLIPDGAFTLATGGNIALASTAVVSRVLEVCYDGTSWYPSY